MKQEYEGPNKLLERRLKQEQLSGRVAGNEVRTNLNNFIENWPAEAERLKGLGYNDEAIRREYTKGVTRITAMGTGLKGAALEEKVTARQEGIDTRRSGQAITGRVADARIAKMGGDAARAERGLVLREKKAVGGGKAGKKPESTEGQFGKVIKTIKNPDGRIIYVVQKKGEQPRNYTYGDDGVIREATPAETKGVTNLGSPAKPKEVNANPFARKPKTDAATPATPAATATPAAKVITATNPKTGQKLMLVNGQWVPTK